VDSAELIARTAAAVADGYRVLDLAAAAGLLLDNYYDGAAEQLAPLAFELREGEVTPDVGRDGYQRELGPPGLDRQSPAFELCEALNERIERDDDGYVLVEVYWLALAARLHRLLGIPVLVPEIEMPIAEQLRRQLDVPMAGEPLAGFDVAVSLPIDDQRVAAVWREPGAIWGSARMPGAAMPVDRNTELGSDPEVRAGWLPPGAVAATVRDRAGVWHEARTGRGVWLCALPQSAGQGDPPVTYRDVDGTEFRLEIKVEGGLPGLWPRQAGARPQLTEQSAEMLGYRARGWDVFIEAHTGFEETAFRPLPGTVLGRAHGFGLELHGGGQWRALAVCGSFTVEIQGDGKPPARLDLEAVPRD
jgi:hypothetical protein